MKRAFHSSVFFTTLCLLFVAGPSEGQPKMAPKPVVVAPVIEKDVSPAVTLVGSIRPLKTSVVGSPVDGRVLEYPIRRGKRVSQGDTLAQLRTGTLEIEREVALAEAKLRREELQELKNGSRPEEIVEARAVYAEAEARRKLAKARLDRKKDLFKQQAISEDEYLDAEEAALIAEKQYLATKASLDLVEIGPREEKILQAQARLLASEEAVRRLEDQIKLHTIRAPFDGYITDERCEVGQWLLKGEAVAEVVLLDKVEAEVNAPEEVAAGVRVGAKARIELPAMPDEILTGDVAFVVPQANPRSRTFPILITVKNVITEDGPLLKSNMFAKVSLPVGTPTKSLLVPKDAIVLGGPAGPMVYVVDAGEENQGSVRPVPVQMGVADGSFIAVKANLQPGDKIVVQGNERLMPGGKVVIQELRTAQVEK